MLSLQSCLFVYDGRFFFFRLEQLFSIPTGFELVSAMFTLAMFTILISVRQTGQDLL
jgi:hypothetical protein